MDYNDYVAQKTQQYGNHKNNPKTMQQRRQCWQTRDAYFTCFESLSGDNFDTIKSRLEHCDQQIQNMYKVCPVSWTENYIKKYLQMNLGLKNSRSLGVSQQKFADNSEALEEFKNQK